MVCLDLARKFSAVMRRLGGLDRPAGLMDEMIAEIEALRAKVRELEEDSESAYWDAIEREERTHL